MEERIIVVDSLLRTLNMPDSDIDKEWAVVAKRLGDCSCNDQNGMDSELVLTFPEPYLEGDETYYNRWKRSHLDIILKQDLVDLENMRHITSIETLIQLLKKKVGSPNFSFFEKYLGGVNKIQIVKDLNREKTYPDGTEIRTAQNWLSEINLE